MTTGNIELEWIPDSTDQSRISYDVALDPSTNEASFVDWTASAQFNQQDQRTGEWIAGGGRNDHYTYTYDPAMGDALTKVTDNNVTTYTYALDGAGNFTSNSGITTSLSTANSVNQYSNLSYNGRGDLTGDGTSTYGFDAEDRLISVTPDTPAAGSTQEQYGYDGNGRKLWMDVNTWNASTSAWDLSYSRHYVWAGNQLTAVLDGDNNLLESYTYGPMGLAAVTTYPADPANPDPSAGPKTYVAVIDLHGSTVELIDPGDVNAGIPASVAANFYYDPYGRLLATSGSAAGVCIVLGKGYLVDSAVPWIGFATNPDGTGRQDRAFNWYTDTYMQRDPAGEIAGGVNLYQGFGGDPINNVDPSGDSPGQYNHGLSYGDYQHFVMWARGKLHLDSAGYSTDPATLFARADALLDATGLGDVSGLSFDQIYDLAQHRLAQQSAATQSVLASGYTGTAGMPSTAADLTQGALNVVQGIQNTAIGLVNLGIKANPVGGLLNVLGVNTSIPSPDWSKGLVANEYGGHQQSVVFADTGIGLVSSAIPIPGLGAAGQTDAAMGLPSMVGASSGEVEAAGGLSVLNQDFAPDPGAYLQTGKPGEQGAGGQSCCGAKRADSGRICCRSEFPGNREDGVWECGGGDDGRENGQRSSHFSNDREMGRSEPARLCHRWPIPRERIRCNYAAGGARKGQAVVWSDD